MAITNYGELRAALQDWARDADIPGTNSEEVIQFAHNTLMRRLKLRDMVLTSTFNITDETVDAPDSNITQVLSFYIDTNPRTALKEWSQTRMDEFTGSTARPAYFAIQGSKIRFAPPPDGNGYSAVMTYKSAFAMFSADGDTNWLLTNYPDAYLYASLYHTGVGVEDNEMQARYDPYTGATATVIDEIVNDNFQREHPLGAGMAPVGRVV